MTESKENLEKIARAHVSGGENSANPKWWHLDQTMRALMRVPIYLAT
jgi:hypothetical protein